MGWRYRRSVKICKGVKVNFSKTGASLTLGGPGHSVNISENGTRVTYGIPGTGLSYTEKISDEGLPPLGSRSRAGKHKSREIIIYMNEKGQISFTYADGTAITDEAVIKKVKSSPQYKTTKENLNRQRLAKIDNKVRNAAAANEAFIHISRLSAVVDSRKKFEKNLQSLQPRTYAIQPYAVPEPNLETVQKKLEQEAEEKVKVSAFRAKKEKKLYVEENLQLRLEEEHRVWKKGKEEFAQQQQEKKRTADVAFQKEYKARKIYLRNLIDGKEDAVCNAFNAWIASCELPVEIDVAYDWDEKERIMMLDVELPGIEAIPETRLAKTSAGNLTEKKKTQKELRGEYAVLVFGLAVFLSSHTFNLSPAIGRILISGYTERRNKEGDLNEEYIYSIKFPRNMFEGKNVSNVDPMKFCLSTENRCNQTSTQLFRKIKPFEEF